MWNNEHVFKTRGESFTKLEQVEQIHEKFTRVVEKSSLGWSRFDWRHDSYEAIKCKIISSRVNPSIIGSCSDVVGSTRPDVLLVGDQKNVKLKHLPVFCSTSGMFLVSCLPKDKTFCLVNSDENLKEKISRVSYVDLIALGKNSASRLKNLNVDFKEASHPQFAKRFYGKNALAKYKQEIGELIT
jgi:hypothetical protein